MTKQSTPAARPRRDAAADPRDRPGAAPPLRHARFGITRGAGRPARLDRERLLQDVLKRDELKFWPKNIDTTPYAQPPSASPRWSGGGSTSKCSSIPRKAFALPAFETFNPQHYRAMGPRRVPSPKTATCCHRFSPISLANISCCQHLTGTGTPAQQKDRIVSFRDAAWGMERGVDLGGVVVASGQANAGFSPKMCRWRYSMLRR